MANSPNEIPEADEVGGRDFIDPKSTTPPDASQTPEKKWVSKTAPSEEWSRQDKFVVGDRPLRSIF